MSSFPIERTIISTGTGVNRYGRADSYEGEYGFPYFVEPLNVTRSIIGEQLALPDTPNMEDLVKGLIFPTKQFIWSRQAQRHEDLAEAARFNQADALVNMAIKRMPDARLAAHLYVTDINVATALLDLLGRSGVDGGTHINVNLVKSITGFSSMGIPYKRGILATIRLDESGDF